MNSIRAVLWDADGVMQTTPADIWADAVAVVSQFPGALAGALIDEQAIRDAAGRLDLRRPVDDVLAVWWEYEILEPVLDVVALVRSAGIACYVATNQDDYRARCMRERTPYATTHGGAYYSCDIGVAKPSAAFFEYIAKDLGLAPEELLFLDDRESNVLSARSVGLRAECWSHLDGTDALRRILAGHGVGVGEGS